MRIFLALFFCLSPLSALAAITEDSDVSQDSSKEDVAFLRPSISEVNRTLVCPQKNQCQAVFIIKGRNFENANGVGAVRIADDWAEVVKWTPTSIVAITDEQNLDRQPAVTVDTSIHRPELLTDDPVLNEMFKESIQVAIDSIRIAPDQTRYVTAGPYYTSPERVYYRDSYWTSGLILLIEPSVIRDQILLLASGIESNGSAPSALPVNPDDRKIPLWVDHYDSGSYFVMLVRDYLAWTGDTSILAERVKNRTIFETMEDALTYVSTRDTDGNLLIDKPDDRALNDWADSIPRPGEVLYNQALFYKAMRDMVDVAKLFKQPSHATVFHRQSLLLRHRINERLWNDEKGYYYERCDKTGCVDRLTNDSSVAALYDVIDPANKQRFLNSLLELESRRNNNIGYGDWGVSNVFPFYEGTKAYFYQNGTDWPFLDGINAGARLRAGDANWYYPMTQWWIYWKSTKRQGVMPEYVSVIDDKPGLSQAWSVNPMFSFVRYGLGFDPDINGNYTIKSSPIKTLDVKNFFVRGKRIERTIQ